MLDKVTPGSVNWKQATKPPIKMPFRKVENCNQVVKIGMQLKLSLVNVAGNDFVQGNKKLILGKSLLCIIFKILDSTFFLFAIYKFIKVIQALHKINKLYQNIPFQMRLLSVCTAKRFLHTKCY